VSQIFSWSFLLFLEENPAEFRLADGNTAPYERQSEGVGRKNRIASAQTIAIVKSGVTEEQMPGKMTVRDFPVDDKRVLVRVDFNVPFEPGTSSISDDSRIRAALPTINFLRERRARVLLASHLGRPGGKISEELRLTPITRRLSELLGASVTTVDDCIGLGVSNAVARIEPSQVLLLENLRFHPEEETNDDRFAASLASLADVFVNDAFGTAHRAHASTERVAHHLPAIAGLLMDSELAMLGGILDAPAKPVATIFGGAKVGDKMAVMGNLVGQSDFMLVGGGMAAAFLARRGLQVGKSLLEANGPELAASVEAAAQEAGTQVLLPIDVVVATEIGPSVDARVVPVEEIPKDSMTLDIGPATRQQYSRALRLCQTVLWNGPLGVFEYEPFARGTMDIAETLAERARNGVTVVVGGGSTAEAVGRFGFASDMTHVSTGGGATLEFLEGRVLPGVAALKDRPE
jgi:phosphoglycerate kinase